MPRCPRFNHPIRKTRKLLGAVEGRTITQGEFARRLGYSTSYLQRIELGQVPPPDALCRKVSVLAGLNPESLKHKNGKPLMQWEPPLIGEPHRHDTPATVESIREWKNFRDGYFDSTTLYALKHAEIAIVALGKAARGNRYCVDAVLLSFQTWLSQTIKDFGLSESFHREWKQRSAEWNAKAKRMGGLLTVSTSDPLYQMQTNARNLKAVLHAHPEAHGGDGSTLAALLEAQLDFGIAG